MAGPIAVSTVVAGCGPALTPGRPLPLAQLTGNCTEFDVLNYNVKGLPDALGGSNVEARLNRIAPLLSRYDIVMLQEVFVAGERLRLRPGEASVVLEGNGPPSGLRRLVTPAGAGLRLALRVPRSHLVRADAVPFDTCAGWLTGWNDCFAHKGFVRARVRIGAAAVLDLYTVHMDAGLGASDRAARIRQLEQLSAFMARESAGAAIIIAGDFTLEHTVAEDRRLLDQFRDALALVDAAIRPDSQRWSEDLDYILYRSGATTELRLLDAGVDSTFVTAGRPLSDHPALRARFRVEPRDPRHHLPVK